MAIGTTAAILAGSAISAGGAALASGSSSRAARRAANAQTQAASQNNALQREIYGSNLQALSPYMQRGNTAGDAINALLGLGGAVQQPQAPQAAVYQPWQGVRYGAPVAGQSVLSEPGLGRDYFGTIAYTPGAALFLQQQPQPPQPAGAPPVDPQQAQEDAFERFRNSTGYQFRVREGQNALQQGYAARGALQSGAAMRALEQFRQNLASGEFGNYLGALQGQQQMGLAGASALAGVGQNFANAVGQNNQNAASAIGNSALVGAANTGNAIGAAVGGINQLLGSSFGTSYNPGYAGGGFQVAPQITAYNQSFLNRGF